MCDFLACPSDMAVMLWLFGIWFFGASLAFFKVKDRVLLYVILSIITNAVFGLASVSGTLVFRIYHIEWLQYFSVFIWPILNIFFIFWYVRTKKR